MRRLQGEIAGVHSDLGRSEEQLEEARRLQAFLEELTPPEWRARLAAEREGRDAARLAAWRAQCERIGAALQARPRSSSLLLPNFGVSAASGIGTLVTACSGRLSGVSPELGRQQLLVLPSGFRGLRFARGKLMRRVQGPGPGVGFET